MDPFFQEELLLWAFSPEQPDLIPTAPTPAVVVRESAFKPYSGRPPPSHRSSGANIHRRVIDLVRKIPKPKEERQETRGFRHMMRERQRRERLSQSYADLYSLISSRSKPDKNSIVQSAAALAKELKGAKERLRRRNEELKSRVLAQGNVVDIPAGATNGQQVKLRVAAPVSPIDSMIGALRYLKSMDVKATAIRSAFSGSELSGVFNVQANEARAAELERGLVVAAAAATTEAEGTFPAFFQQTRGLERSRERIGALSGVRSARAVLPFS